MIKNKSRQTAQLTALKVQEDLTRRGWLVIIAPEESVYDFIVDRGLVDGERLFETIQVKTQPRTSSRPNPHSDNERVSTGGKVRNSYWYIDEGITYIASIMDERVVYWHKDQYKKLTPKALKSTPKYEFPLNNKVVSYRIETNIGNTLEDFF